MNTRFSARNIKFGLIIFVALAILLVVFYLANNKINLFGRAGSANGVLSLPSGATVNTGDQFDAPVMVSSPDNTLASVDVVIGFDRGVLQLVDITPRPENSMLQNYLPVSGGQFDKARVIQKANDEGQIRFGAFSYNAQFKGDLGPGNPLAVLKFQAKNAGQTTINYVFSGGATNDSNLVDDEATDTL